MDRYKVVHRGYHGLTRLPREELASLYHDKRIRPHTARYHWIDTLFALSEVTSYAAVVSALEARGDSVDYDKLFHDVRASIDEAHADGTVYGVVTNALTPDTTALLTRFGVAAGTALVNARRYEAASMRRLQWAWKQLQAGARAFLKSASDPVIRRIVLVDGPSVLGWEEWRRIDAQYAYGMVRVALQAAG